MLQIFRYIHNILEQLLFRFQVIFHRIYLKISRKMSILFIANTVNEQESINADARQCSELNINYTKHHRVESLKIYFLIIKPN